MNLILDKYKHFTDNLINSIKVYPKDYKVNSKSAYVYFFYYVDGKRYKFKKAQYYYDGVEVPINRIKDLKKRAKAINILIQVISFNLRSDPKIILKYIYGIDKAKELYPEVYQISNETKRHTIEYCFNLAVENKKETTSGINYMGVNSIKNRFISFIGHKKNLDVKTLNKQIFVEFLQHLSKEVANSSLNQYRTFLGSLVGFMVDKEFIDVNYVNLTKKLKVKSQNKNKAFSNDLRDKILEYAKDNDVIVYNYLCHVYYALMRPQTALRLKIKDVDLVKGIFDTKTKTGNFSKVIPKKLIELVYDDERFRNANPEHYVFGRKQMFDEWRTKDLSKRNTLGIRFSKIKKHFELDNNYTIYSFRHTAIVNIFETKSKELKDLGVSDYKNKAVEFIMPITNHKTKEQTKEYLRGVSTEIHEDWSKYL